jgi:hypothetical protein
MGYARIGVRIHSFMITLGSGVSAPIVGFTVVLLLLLMD